MDVVDTTHQGGPAGRLSTPSVLYSLIWRNGAMSRAELVEQAGLTKSTVSASIEALISAGLIQEVGYRSSGPAGGRRAALLQARAESRVVAGAHIGVRRTTVVVTDALGLELATASRPTLINDPARSLEDVAGMTSKLLGQLNIDHDKLSAIGVAVPGLVNSAGGTCLLAPNLGWRQVHVTDELKAWLGVPVFVSNTVHAMATAESCETGEDGGNLALLYIGTGVGCAIIDRDRLIRGAHGFAGEIGHTNVGGNIPCSCGRTGCLETQVSGPAILRRAADIGLIPAETVDSLSPLSVGHLAEAGNANARAFLSSIAAELAPPVASVIHIANPRTLVMAGGVASLGPLLIEPLRHALSNLLMPELFATLTIRESRLHHSGKLRGAVLTALQQVDPVDSTTAS